MKNFSTIPRMKRMFVAALLLAMGFTFSESTSQCVTPPSGLVSWWPGEGNANDIIASNHGTLQNGVSFAPGKVGNAFSFDGVDDGISILKSSDLNLGAGDFTITAWVKFTADFPGSGDVEIFLNYAGINYYSLMIEADGERAAVGFRDGNSNHIRLVGTTSLNDGQWHFLTGLRNGTTGLIYVDGILEGSTTNPAMGSINTGTCLYARIGAAHSGPGHCTSPSSNLSEPHFNGLIDELDLYNRPLSAAEVAAIYNAGSTGKCTNLPPVCVNPPSGLVSWWRSENDANDFTSGNNGTLINGATFSPGKVGQAFSFDGVDDYVIIASSANLTLTSAVSVELWFNASSQAANQVLASRVDGVGQGWQVDYTANGGMNFWIGTGGIWARASTSSPSSNTWHHVAGTWDGSIIRLYVDGVEVNSTAKTGAISASATEITIGTYNADLTAGYFKGLIDEVDIYNRALSASEIQAIYNAGSAGKCNNTPPPVCVNPPSGLVSWWPGDEDANDMEDGNNGSLMNGATFATGNVGQAFMLDGTNDYVEIPDNSNLTPSSITLDAWVKPDVVSGNPPIVSKYNSNNPSVNGVSWVLLMFASGQVRFVVYQDAAGNIARGIDTDNAVLSTGIWQHVAATFDLATQEIKIYVNGIEVPSTLISGASSTITSIADSNTPVRIGTFVNSLGNFDAFWGGLIDEVDIYNRALSASEIQAIYNAGSAGKCTNTPPPVCVNPPSGLVSWWPGDDNANDIQSSNYGTLQNGATFAAGKVGQAFSFDGVDDFVRIEDNSNLRLGTGEITFDAWIKASPSNTFRAIAAKVGLTFPFPGYALRIADDNKVEFFAVDCATGSCGFSGPGGGGSRQPVRSISVVADNTFHHVAGVRRSDGTLEIYVDGVLENTRLEPLRNTDSADPFTIGEIDAVGPEQPFNGLIDEVDIYNRALSASEIQSIYNAGSAGKCKECTPPEVSITGDDPVCPNSTHPYTANTNAANPTFAWSVTGGTIDGDNTGNSVSVIAGDAGTMTVSVEVNDGATNCSNSVTQEVTVEDTEAPVITAAAPASLWPPNHKYVTINLSQCVVAVSDNCADLATSNVIISKVTSDEPEDAPGGGDGNTANDIVIASDCKSAQLRSERQGSGNGRVYTIHLSVSDGNNGNTGTATCTVTVPKSQNGNPAVDDSPIYTVGSSCGSGASKLSQQDFMQETLPEGYALEQNYPNPFNPSTSIAFSVKEAGVVQLSIYNLHGQEVRTLINGQMNVGFHSVSWDGKDNNGQILPSGVYLYKLRVNGFTQTRKMTSMK